MDSLSARSQQQERNDDVGVRIRWSDLGFPQRHFQVVEKCGVSGQSGTPHKVDEVEMFAVIGLITSLVVGRKCLLFSLLPSRYFLSWLSSQNNFNSNLDTSDLRPQGPDIFSRRSHVPPLARAQTLDFQNSCIRQTSNTRPTPTAHRQSQ